MAEQNYKGHEIPVYTVKGSRKFKDIQVRLLLKLCETSIISLMVENVCNTVLLLVAADWFSPIIASKAYTTILKNHIFLSIVV